MINEVNAVEVAVLILNYCDDDWAVERLMDEYGMTEDEARCWLAETRRYLPH